jgi:hypothetical protein
MSDIPKETLEDACQLVKANSIQASSAGMAWGLCKAGGAGLFARLGAAVAGMAMPCGQGVLPLLPAVAAFYQWASCFCSSNSACMHSVDDPLQGNKQANVPIVYTPASNLRKTADMATGQVRSQGAALLWRRHQCQSGDVASARLWLWLF